ncbi:hypothetical protein AB0I13_27145, partial [Streptomyces prasinus]
MHRAAADTELLGQFGLALEPVVRRPLTARDAHADVLRDLHVDRGGDVAPDARKTSLVGTRELCTQVTNDLLTAGKVRNVRVTAIYGGRA